MEAEPTLILLPWMIYLVVIALLAFLPWITGRLTGSLPLRILTVLPGLVIGTALSVAITLDTGPSVSPALGNMDHMSWEMILLILPDAFVDFVLWLLFFIFVSHHGSSSRRAAQ